MCIVYLFQGRKRGGGIRFGEMERDSLLAHGVSYMLRDRLMKNSDYDEVDIDIYYTLDCFRSLKYSSSSFPRHLPSAMFVKCAAVSLPLSLVSMDKRLAAHVEEQVRWFQSHCPMCSDT